MMSEPYELLVRGLIKSAKTLDHSKDACAEDFIPQKEVRHHVLNKSYTVKPGPSCSKLTTS